MAPEIPDRWVTTAARGALARRFNLPYDPFSQGRAWEVADPSRFDEFLTAYWAWEVADPSRFDEFLTAYVADPLDEDERFALMEILIQCIEDMDLPSVESSPQWNSVAGLLRAHAGLHASSVRYWSCLGDHDLEDCFRVTGPMRAVWEVIDGTDAGSRDPTSCE
jgi:hypothetical protein